MFVARENGMPKRTHFRTKALLGLPAAYRRLDERLNLSACQQELDKSVLRRPWLRKVGVEDVGRAVVGEPLQRFPFEVRRLPRAPSAGPRCCQARKLGIVADEVHLWRIGSDEQLTEISVRPLDLESRLQEWLARDIRFSIRICW